MVSSRLVRLVPRSLPARPSLLPVLHRSARADVRRTWRPVGLVRLRPSAAARSSVFLRSAWADVRRTLFRGVLVASFVGSSRSSLAPTFVYEMTYTP